MTRRSDIVTEQASSLAISNKTSSLSPYKKAKSVRTAAFWARQYYSESGKNKWL